jgi:hypothetical protein
MHKLIVSSRAAEFKGTQKCRSYGDNVRTSTDVVRVDTPQSRYEHTRHWRENVDRIESSEDNRALKIALIEHIWNSGSAREVTPDVSDS